MKNLFNYFKRRKRLTEDRKIVINPADFKTGEIYKMDPGYYTKNPYYIKIKEVNTFGIETMIPGQHSLKIEFGSLTWSYQIPRMTYMGIGEKYEKLIYNQRLD